VICGCAGSSSPDAGGAADAAGAAYAAGAADAADGRPTTSLVAELQVELRQLATAGTAGSAVNSRLGQLAAAALTDDPSIVATLAAAGFVQGEHARQFHSELTTDDMLELADALQNAHGEGDGDDGFTQNPRIIQI
jgi:hypothetical protein